MSRAILWPRHEVLQLVLPVFSTCGILLTEKIIIEVAKRLMQVENSTGIVTFDQYILISSDVLKWNEATSQLFWDMLNAAVWYKVQTASNSIELKTNHVVLFLALHIAEHSGAKSPVGVGGSLGSPHQFDSVWPGAADGASGDGARSPRSSAPHSPTSSPPNKEKKSFFASMSPKSPRNSSSPRSSGSPNSPRKSLFTAARPTAAHHLNCIRMRLPLVLRALALRADPAAVASTGDKDPSTPREALEEDLFLYQGDIDCLGLIIGGGSNRDEEVPLLSELHPHAPSGGNGSESAHPVHMLCNETLEWFVANLCVNESVYPSSPQSAVTSSPGGAHDAAAAATATNILIASRVITHSGPVRIISPLQYLSTSRPTVISGASSVIVHAMAVSIGRSRSRSATASSFQESLTAAVRSASGLSLDEANNTSSKEAFSPGATSSWYESGMDTSCSMDRDDSTSSLQSVQSNVLSRADYEKVGDLIDALKTKTTTETLPHMNVQNCSHTSVYLLSPYATGSVTNCSDCELITGPVAGTIIIADCERVRVTTVARKVILRNCFDCVINCQTLSPVIVAGDSRGLLVGPYNTSYKDLAVHMELASLTSLMKPMLRQVVQGRESRTSSSASAVPSRSYLNRSVSECLDDDDVDVDELDKDNGQSDLWSVLWDASLCTDPQHQHQHPAHLSSDSLAALLQASFSYGISSVTMATPSESTATLLPVDKFRCVAIPEQSQYQTFEHCPIEIPTAYTRYCENQRATGAALAMRISAELNAPPPPPPPQETNMSPPRVGASDAGPEDETASGESEGTNLLSGKFMV